jgi:hypothetical protein
MLRLEIDGAGEEGEGARGFRAPGGRVTEPVKLRLGKSTTVMVAGSPSLMNDETLCGTNA